MRLQRVVLFASLAAGSAAIVAAVALVGRGLMCLALIPVLLVGFWMRRRASPVQHAAWLGVVAAAVLVFGAHSAKVAWSNAANPSEWDLQIFALYGRTAAQGLNPYDADDLRSVPLAGRHTEVFVADILRDGFPGQGEYTPPVLFLLAPFAWFDVRTSPWLWYLASAFVIGADVLLLWRLFLPDSGGSGLLLIAALVLAFRPTQATLALGQYNFLALLAALLYWRDRASVRGGLWLGAGAVVRSPLAILVLHPIRAFRWRTVAAALLTVVVLWALAAATFHAATVVGYFGTLGKALPAHIYAETINQSLLGTVLRLAGATSPPASPLLHPAYLGFGALLVVATLGLLWRLPREADWACGLTVPLALMIHPSILEHYSVLLLFPLLVLWSRAVDGFGTIIFLAIEYALVGIGDGEWVFVATAACWLWCAWMAIATIAGDGGRKIMKAALVLSLLIAVGPVLAADPPEPKVTSVMTKPLPDFPGKEALMITVEYPPGGADPIHKHNAHAFVYVLEGSIIMGLEGGKPVTLTPGQTFYEGPKDVHTIGRNASQTEPAKFVVLLLKDENAPALIPVK